MRSSNQYTYYFVVLLFMVNEIIFIFIDEIEYVSLINISQYNNINLQVLMLPLDGIISVNCIISLKSIKRVCYYKTLTCVYCFTNCVYIFGSSL